MQETKEIFSKNLKMELELRGISQNKLAKALNVKHQTVNDWTRGKNLPSLAMFRKLCIILKAEPERILNIDVESEIPFSVYELIK